MIRAISRLFRPAHPSSAGVAVFTAVLAMGALSPGAEAQGLVAHYELNEAVGATVCVDSSSNQLNGAFRNVSNFGLGASSPGCGSAVAFDETVLSDVIIPGAFPLDTLTENLTLCAWINPNAIPAANTVQRIFGNNNDGWTCGLRGDGLIFTTRFIQDYLFNGVPITPMAWNHVAFVFDASYSVTVYVNGVPMGTVLGGAPARFPSADWFIGGFDGNIEFFDGLIDDVQVYDGALDAAAVAFLAQDGCNVLGATVGTVYCDPAVPNSTGSPASISGTGSSVIGQADLTLRVASLPPTSFAYFLTSQTRGLTPQPNGSQGVLCLGGAIGRYIAPGEIQQADAAGNISITLDISVIPQPTGFVSGMVGQTWAFQAWYRDFAGGSLTSNFSDGYEVVLL